MTTPDTPTDAKTAAVALNHEETLRQAWERHGNTVYLVCGAIALGILAKGGWDYLNRQKELGIQNEYAQCVTIESFRSFASSHVGHPLAGAAEVVVADISYASGKFGDAVTAYSEAASDLPAGPIQARAKLGLAMSLALTGKVPEAETDLRQVLGDSTIMNATRCEAGYHLAALAAANGRPGDVQKLAEQVMQIDPESPFAERTFALRSSLPDAAGAPGVPIPAKP